MLRYRVRSSVRYRVRSSRTSLGRAKVGRARHGGIDHGLDISSGGSRHECARVTKSNDADVAKSSLRENDGVKGCQVGVDASVYALRAREGGKGVGFNELSRASLCSLAASRDIPPLQGAKPASSGINLAVRGLLLVVSFADGRGMGEIFSRLYPAVGMFTSFGFLATQVLRVFKCRGRTRKNANQSERLKCLQHTTQPDTRADAPVHENDSENRRAAGRGGHRKHI